MEMGCSGDMRQHVRSICAPFARLRLLFVVLGVIR